MSSWLQLPFVAFGPIAHQRRAHDVTNALEPALDEIERGAYARSRQPRAASACRWH